MRVRRRSCSWLLGVAALLVMPRPALAEASSTDKAAAEALFDSGVQLLRTRDYKQACTKLEASQQIDPAVGTLLYLGECYERLGRSASAWATFREASSVAQASGQPDRAKIAAQRAARLEPELAYVTVSVPAESVVPGLVVRRGGEPIAAALYGQSVPVDPGEITVEASAPGHLPFSGKVQLAARERQTVSVPPLKRSPAAAGEAQPPPGTSPAPVESTAPAAPAPGPAVPTENSRPIPTLSYVLGGAGLVAAGVGSYFGLRAMARNDDAESYCSGSTCREQRGVDLSDQANNAARVSNVAFALGAGCLIGGALVYLLSPPKAEHAMVLAPSVSRQLAGVTLGGAFD